MFRASARARARGEARAAVDACNAVSREEISRGLAIAHEEDSDAIQDACVCILCA